MSGGPEPRVGAGDTDFDALMRAHLARVLAERDAGRRLAGLRELYAEDTTLFEPGTAVTGRKAISDAINALLASMPPSFSFTATGPAVGHHGLARLHWRAGPPGGPAVVTGTDVAGVEGGRIKSLHVFLDPQPA